MARAALNWSTQQLAEEASVGANTVNRFEAGHDVRMSSVNKIRTALELAGVEFIDGQYSGDGGPGVRKRA
jgi:transcriptional regulator with XRE-family HTH domain